MPKDAKGTIIEAGSILIGDSSVNRNWYAIIHNMEGNSVTFTDSDGILRTQGNNWDWDRTICVGNVKDLMKHITKRKDELIK